MRVYQKLCMCMYARECVCVPVVDVDAGVGVHLRQYCVARRRAIVCINFVGGAIVCIHVSVCDVQEEPVILCMCVCVHVLSTSTVLPFAIFFFQLIVRLLLDDVTDVCLICLICVNLIVACPTHSHTYTQRPFFV